MVKRTFINSYTFKRRTGESDYVNLKYLRNKVLKKEIQCLNLSCLPYTVVKYNKVYKTIVSCTLKTSHSMIKPMKDFILPPWVLIRSRQSVSCKTIGDLIFGLERRVSVRWILIEVLTENLGKILRNSRTKYVLYHEFTGKNLQFKVFYSRDWNSTQVSLCFISYYSKYYLHVSRDLSVFFFSNGCYPAPSPFSNRPRRIFSTVDSCGNSLLILYLSTSTHSSCQVRVSCCFRFRIIRFLFHPLPFRRVLLLSSTVHRPCLPIVTTWRSLSPLLVHITVLQNRTKITPKQNTHFPH